MQAAALTETTRLSAVGWDHPRCMAPMRAAARAWQELEGVAVEWSVRSLRAFGDQPIEEIASSYDVIVVDHPFVGTTAATRCLRPLEQLLHEDELASFAADSIGPSHASYAYAGSQWALAVDAACQVSAVRPDLVDEPPRTWEEVLALARRERARVAVPLRPADAICCFATLCANAGAPPGQDESALAPVETATWAVELLGELVALGHPRSLDLDPPNALELLVETDEVVYVPLCFGYTNYSRPAGRRACRFTDIPSAGSGPNGSVLGGAGLAVSAASDRPAAAAAFAAWACGSSAQRTVVFPAGGQPASRAVWLDDEADRASGGFFSGTRRTIEAAYVRPRDRWWPPFQRRGGEALNDLLRRRTPAAEVVRRLELLHRRARRDAAA